MIADQDVDVVLNLTTPLAITFKEAKELYDLAREKNLRLGSAPDTFFGSRQQIFRELIDNGDIGKVSGFSANVVLRGPQTFHPNPAFMYKYGAGPLLDIGPYYVVALLSLLGPVKRISAMSNRQADVRVVEAGPRKGDVLDIEMDTHVVANLEFCNGAIGTLTASFDRLGFELAASGNIRL